MILENLISPSWIVTALVLCWYLGFKPWLKTYALKKENKAVGKIIPVIDIIFQKIDQRMPQWIESKTGDQILESICEIIEQVAFSIKKEELEDAALYILSLYDPLTNADNLSGNQFKEKL